MKSVRESMEIDQTEEDRSKVDQASIDLQNTELEETISGILNSSEKFVIDLVHKVSLEIEHSVQRNSEHISERLIELKNELNLSKHVHEHPWQWIGISALAGFSLRMLTSSASMRRLPVAHVQPSTGKSILASAALPFLALALEKLGSRMMGGAAESKTRSDQSH